MKFIFALVATILAVVSAGVYHVGDNFKQVTAEGVWFVKFYAPWCGHCKKLAPVWEQLANKVETDGTPINIASVDCTVAKDVCQAQGVKGYPTLLSFTNGVVGPKYAKARTLDALFEYSQQVSAGHTKVIPSEALLSGSASGSVFAKLAAFPTSDPKVNLFICLGAITAFVIIAGIVSGKAAGKKANKIAKKK